MNLTPEIEKLLSNIVRDFLYFNRELADFLSEPIKNKNT